MNPVLEKVRKKLAGRNSKAPYPEWPEEVIVSQPRLAHGSLQESFESNFTSVHGTILKSIGDVSRHLVATESLHGYCDPALAEQMRTNLNEAVSLETNYDRLRYDDYQFGITRASGAIAESGTLILSDAETPSRLSALTPWVHVAVVDPKTIFRTIADAISALGDDPNTIWVTGPSKTADVEGILIEGVHGPGEQIALIIP